MKYGFFSDVHGNLEALQAVLKSMERNGVEQIFFLGDAVGYGPDPNECAAIIDGIAGVKLAGNHDHAVLGKTDITNFNDRAKKAIEWTRKNITVETRKILEKFQLTYQFSDFFLVHSTPNNPEEWDYILDFFSALDAFSNFTQQICLIGHSHSPLCWKDEDGVSSIIGTQFKIRTGVRYIINVGSVGQPRDGDNRACYVIYDDETRQITFKRVVYDFTITQEKMRKAGLPDRLIERLALGI